MDGKMYQVAPCITPGESSNLRMGPARAQRSPARIVLSVSCLSSLSWLKTCPWFPMTEGISQSRDRHRRAVQLILWHTIQRLDQIVRGQLAALRDRPSHNKFRKHGPARDRRPAADRVILRTRNATVFDPQKQNQERAPAGCAGMASEIGAFHHPAVARRQHVVHHRFGVLTHGFL
jgi:hypothetical protein